MSCQSGPHWFSSSQTYGRWNNGTTRCCGRAKTSRGVLTAVSTFHSFRLMSMSGEPWSGLKCNDQGLEGVFVNYRDTALFGALPFAAHRVGVGCDENARQLGHAVNLESSSSGAILPVVASELQVSGEAHSIADSKFH